MTSPINGELSNRNHVSFEIEAILKNSHQRQVPYRNSWNNYKEELFTPVYKLKTGKQANIMLFVKVSSSLGGFNIVLLDNGTLYGDWVIKETYWLSGSGMNPQVPEHPFAVSVSEINDQPLIGSINNLKSNYEYDFNEKNLLSKILLILGISSF